MRMRSLSMAIVAAIAAVGSLAGMTAAVAAQSAGPAVAGLQPDRRPVSAPTIKELHHDEAWYARVRLGVSKPYPPSLKFLESQGAWYTPFAMRGMPGRYDIRKLHRN
jgi:hypothetical protein